MSFVLTAAVLAIAAQAPEAAAETPQPAAVAAPQGVTAYPAEFFASGQPGTAFDMINRLPGFSFDEGDSVRGFAGAAGNVLIDGERPTTKSDDLKSVLRRIPAGQVLRIDLIRGGAPGIDMQGKTVIANIVRRNGEAVTGLVALSNVYTYDGRFAPGMRLEGARRADGKTLEGSFVIAGYIDDGAGDGPYEQRDPAGNVVERAHLSTEGDGTQVVATGAFETPLLGGKFRINARGFGQRFYYGERNELIPGPDLVTDRELETRKDGELGLRWGRDLGPRTKVETLFIQQLKTTDFHADFAEPAGASRFAFNRHVGESIARGVLSFRQSDTLSLEAGGEAAFNWLDNQTRYSQDGVPAPLPAADVRVQETRGEGFVQGTWKPWSVLTLEGGLRVETSRITAERDVTLEKSLTFAKPRLVATWSATPKDQLRFRVEREVGQLNFNDVVASSAINTGGGVTAGNPDINPEQAWVAEAVYERRFWDRGSISLGYRHSKVTDAIDRAPVFADDGGVFDAPSNIGDGTRDRVWIEVSLPLDRFGVKGGLLKGDVTRNWSKVTDPTTGQQRPISGEHPLDWNASFSQDLPAWKVTWGVDAYGAWRETYYRFNRIETTKLNTFVVPFVEWKVRPDTILRMEIQNVTSRDLSRYQQLYDGPRGTSPLQATATRRYDNGPMLFLRVRKSFG